MKGVIPAGADRIDFVKSRYFNPKVIFPPEEPEDSSPYGMDYDEDEDGCRYINTKSALLDLFASALDGQTKFISGLSRVTRTSRNCYIDSLIKLCKTEIGVADAVLIQHVAYVVTGQTFSRPSIDYRIKKLS